jgi:hypothetical protein
MIIEYIFDRRQRQLCLLRIVLVRSHHHQLTIISYCIGWDEPRDRYPDPLLEAPTQKQYSTFYYYMYYTNIIIVLRLVPITERFIHAICGEF